MATYPLTMKPSIPYNDHLLLNEYVSDITTGIEKTASSMHQGIEESAAVIAEGNMHSAELLSETLDINFDFLAETVAKSTTILHKDVQQLNGTVSLGLSEVKYGIAGLQSRFDIGMGKSLAQFELMRNEIQDSFNEVIKLLENKRKSQANEHFGDAIDYYNDGCRFPDKPKWMENALNHLLASVKEYDRNPLAHFLIGHIYHYEKSHQNFEKAVIHYTTAYTYGEANPKDYSVAAQGCFYAGWLQAAVFHNLEDAVRLTKESLRFDNNIPESHYHLAKFYSVLGEHHKAIEHLETAIKKFDKEYCKKAVRDPDFYSIRNEVNELFIKLRNEARDNFAQIINPYFIEIQESLDDTYFAYLDLLKIERKQQHVIFINILKSIDKARSRLEAINPESSIVSIANVALKEIESRRTEVLANFKESLRVSVGVSIATEEAKKQAEYFERRFIDAQFEVNGLINRIEKIEDEKLKDYLLSKLHDTDRFTSGVAIIEYVPEVNEGIVLEREDIKGILDLYSQAKNDLNVVKSLIEKNISFKSKSKSKIDDNLQSALKRIEYWQASNSARAAFEEAISLINISREYIDKEILEKKQKEYFRRNKEIEKRRKENQKVLEIQHKAIKTITQIELLFNFLLTIAGIVSGAVSGSIIVSIAYFVIAMVLAIIGGILLLPFGMTGEFVNWLEDLRLPVTVAGLVLGAIAVVIMNLVNDSKDNKFAINIGLVVVASILFTLCIASDVVIIRDALMGIDRVVELMGFDLL